MSYIVFWILLYFEGILIGPVTIGQLWKFPIESYALLIALILFLKRRKYPLQGFISLFLIVTGIITTRIILMGDFIQSLQFFLNTIIYLIVYIYLINRNEYGTTKKLLLKVSLFLILCNIPFLLGVPIRTDAIDLSRFGLEDQNGLSGLFYNVSVNSKIIVSSIIVFLTLYSGKRKIYLTVIGLAGMYFLLLTYTRTGIFTLILAILYYFYRIKNLSLSRFAFYGIMILIGLGLLYQIESVGLRMRGGTTYRPNEELNLDIITSYRLTINAASIDQFVEDDLINQLFGQGPSRTKDRLLKYHGINFIPHSKFIQILCYWGYFGISFYVLLLIFLFKKIRSVNNSKEKYLAETLLILEVLWSFVSHGSPIWSQLLLGLVIYRCLIQPRSINNAYTAYTL